MYTIQCPLFLVYIFSDGLVPIHLPTRWQKVFFFPLSRCCLVCYVILILYTEIFGRYHSFRSYNFFGYAETISEIQLCAISLVNGYVHPFRCHFFLVLLLNCNFPSLPSPYGSVPSIYCHVFFVSVAFDFFLLIVVVFPFILCSFLDMSISLV